VSFLDWLKTVLSVGSADNRPLDFPPSHLKAEWDEIEGYIIRYKNDRAELLKRDAEFGRGDDEKKSLFTPVPLAAEMARLSSQLLFSAEPKFVNEQQEKVTERVVEANGPGEFFLDAGEHVAVQGYGGLRVIRDGEISDVPLVTHVPANRTIFRIRHGRFVTGGYVVIERRPDPFRDEVYRLVEDHKPGRIERALYKGNRTSLGATIPHARWLEEFSGLPESTDTRMDAPTLYRWNNVPGGWSDLARLDSLFDLLNEAESTGKEKLRKSAPIVFADRKLADKQGRVNLQGVILTGGTTLPADQGLAKTVETAERRMDAEAHKLYVAHLRDSILMYGGYSLASWGLDDGGSADSGKALRLRQQRTLLTKAGKERSARAAITAAFAAACCWSEKARDPKAYRPDLQLGDGLPRDPVEDAQVIATLDGAEVVSDEQALRFLHPEWGQKQIDEELERLEKEKEAAAPPGFAIGGFGRDPRQGGGNQDQTGEGGDE
jgi:hypothetical protein